MKSPYQLSFISDADLFAHTLDTVKRFRTGMTLDEFQKNTVDPIKLAFDVHVYRRNIQEVIDAEIMRQLSKTNENLIGYFHQNLFRYIGRGWEVPNTGDDGFDVVNHGLHIFAEFKNKHNTMNSGAAKSVHAHMKGLVEGDKKARCYLVEVIAQKSQDIEWCLVNAPLRADRQERLRRISIDRFYEIATGDPCAFRDLCRVLGRVIDDIIEENPLVVTKTTVLEELAGKDKDILRHLFLLAFGSYRGFDEFTLSK